MAQAPREVSMKGYKEKPLAITLIAVGFLLIPVALAVQLAAFSGGSWRLALSILSSRYFLQEWILSWSAAAAVAIVSRWSLAYFILLSGYVLTTRFSNWATHPTLETPLNLGITCFWFGVVTLILVSEMKTPYLHPQLRWWTRPRRHPISGEAILLYQGIKVPVEVLNISEGGVFVRLDESKAAHRPFPQRLGEQFQFEMALLPRQPQRSSAAAFRSTARLVWRALPQSPYRYGMGIRFIALSPDQRRLLKKYLRHEA